MFIFITLIPIVLSQTLYNDELWQGICNTGKLQSPINIDTSYNFVSDSEYIKIISRDYEPITNKPFSLKNNSTISLDYDKKSSLVVEINKVKYQYYLKEIQLHVPSEHTINGNQTELELQLIHEKDSSKNVTDGKTDIVIISFLYKATAAIDNALVNEWKFDSGNSNINVTKYYKPEKGFYHYVGSYTTEPCAENVNWIIMEDFSYMSPTQLKSIKAKIFNYFNTGNSRAVKPIRSRSLYYTPNAHLASNYIFYSIFSVILYSIIF